VDVLPSVVRFNANADRLGLDCGWDPRYSKSAKDENAAIGITQNCLQDKCMKTYNHLYQKLCSLENLDEAYRKARKRKMSRGYVKAFEEHRNEELAKLQRELSTGAYLPQPLKKFIVRDPKTRTIHASHFRDRVVYHALVNILEPIFEPLFMYDSYASRKGKGTHKAVQRIECFMRKVAKNGRLVKNPHTNNSVTGYVFKADIRHYFDTVNHGVLLNILQRKIKDERVIWLVEKILRNFNTKSEGKGMPLGNLTSQFFANVYLNELDQHVKHQLKMKYYLRYVDDVMVFHQDRKVLNSCKESIEKYARGLNLELHPDKSKIISLRKGVAALGYRNFYHYKLLRKSNARRFERTMAVKLQRVKEGSVTKEKLMGYVRGWFGYAKWANTHNYGRDIQEKINQVLGSKATKCR